MVDKEPAFEQRLRADGTYKRNPHQGGNDPPYTEATREESVNLTKQALRVDPGSRGDSEPEAGLSLLGLARRAESRPKAAGVSTLRGSTVCERDKGEVYTAGHVASLRGMEAWHRR